LVRSCSPSLLAKKILCPAYVPAPFNKDELLKLQGLHARAALNVIARHMKLGYKLLGVEVAGNGFRIDLLFKLLPSGKIRLVEVKSSKQIREVYKIQAALYHPSSAADEIAVSNRERDELLTSDYIHEILRRAEMTRRLLATNPSIAARTHTPHPDACYTCCNTSCLYLRDRRADMTSKRYAHLRTLDPYLVSEEPTKKNTVTFVNVNLVNVNLSTEPARVTFDFKVKELVKAVRDLMARDKHALDGRLYDMLVMRGIVVSEDEYMRVKRIAHRMGRIVEDRHINGAWIALDNQPSLA